MIIVSDSFGRPDDTTSMGVADTGQVWESYDSAWTPDTRWGILSNQAARLAGGNPSVGPGGFALVETGFRNVIVRATINNIEFGGDLNNANYGIILRWAASDNYWMITWSRAGKFLRICQVAPPGNFICTNTGFPGSAQLNVGDVIEGRICGRDIEAYVNDDLRATSQANFLPAGMLGTKHGIQCGDGVINDAAYALFDNFVVETNIDCEEGLIFLPPLQVSGVGEVGGGGGDQPEIVPCSPSEPPSNPIPRVQRVVDFTQEIHRNVQLQISSVAPLTLYGYSMEWVPVSISQLTEQRNAYGANWQFAEYGHLFYAYIAHISNADLEVTIAVDAGAPTATTDTYTLISSSGAFRKDWLILRARKGKLFDIKITSTEEFQIILPQSVLFGKEYKSSGAYQPLNCFGDQTV